MSDIEKLRDLIDKYLDAAWREGNDGRMHDAEDGAAMVIRHDIEQTINRLQAARSVGDGEVEPVVAYRYRVIDDPQGWEYSQTPLFGPESGPGPKEEYQALTLDQLLSELNDTHPPATTHGGEVEPVAVKPDNLRTPEENRRINKLMGDVWNACHDTDPERQLAQHALWDLISRFEAEVIKANAHPPAPAQCVPDVGAMADTLGEWVRNTTGVALTHITLVDIVRVMLATPKPDAGAGDFVRNQADELEKQK